MGNHAKNVTLPHFLKLNINGSRFVYARTCVGRSRRRWFGEFLHLFPFSFQRLKKRKRDVEQSAKNARQENQYRNNDKKPDDNEYEK